MKNLIRSLLGNTVKSNYFDENLQALMQVLQYSFNTEELLLWAITHTSTEHCEENILPFERMEFLGDSVLGLIIAEALFLKFPDFTEGQLSKLKAKVVSRKFLAAVARDMKLGDFLKVSPETEAGDLRNNSSVLADTMETIICAVYLDGGLEAARNYVIKRILSDYEKVLGKKDLVNYKSKLQEYTQDKNQKLPEYRLVSEEGPDHIKTFVVEVLIDNKIAGCGSGRSKKEAQQQAAKSACKKLQL